REAGAVFASRAVEDHRPVLAIAQGREQGAEARRATPRIVAIVLGQIAHYEEGRGAPVLDRTPDLVADARLDVRADDAAIDTIDLVGRLGSLVDAAQIDDRAHAKPAKGRAIGLG